MSNIDQTGSLAPQSLLQGRYIIIATVGEGGMGSVYKAIDVQEENRLVAIKEMSLSHYQSPTKLREAEKLFHREAEILSNLSHPNLPRVYDFFNENGRSYLVMDFIKGKTLGQLLAESDTPWLPVKDMIDYALQLCDALSYLHQQTPPVIFRDLKPANVMVTATGSVYLIDFGIARVFKRGLNHDTQKFGTPGFASPEQHGNGQTGPRSDLYSLGATLYYCLTGKDPRANKPTFFDFSPAHEDNPQVPLNLSELIQCLVTTREGLRPPGAEIVQHELLYIQRCMNNANTKITSDYDLKIASTTQLSLWMIRNTKLPGHLQRFAKVLRPQNEETHGRYKGPIFLTTVGVWWANTMVPVVANMYGILCIWFVLVIMPRSQQLYRNGIHVISAWPRELWQSFSNTEAQVLAQAVWTPHFTLLFVLSTIGIIGSTLYMLIILHYPVYLVAFYLCLLLFLIIGKAFTNQRIHHPLARSILMTISLFLLIISIALFALPEVQPSIRATTFNQLFTVGILVLATVAFLRPTQHLVWMDNLCLAVVAATYALLLNNMGAQALRQLLLIRMNNAIFINIAFISLLCIIAIIELVQCEFLIIRRNYLWGNHLQLFIVALIAALLQFTYGLQELLHLPPSTFPTQQIIEQSLNLVTCNVLLAGIPVVIVLLRLFLAPGSSHLSRFLLLQLGLTCAALQNFLGPVIQFPLLKAGIHPLSTSLASIMHTDQLAAYSLVLIAYILIRQWRRPFGWFDQFSLLCVVTVCAFLQSAASNNNEASQSSHGIPTQLSQLYMIVINKLLAQALMLIVLAIPTIAISRIFLHLANDFSWVDRQITRVHQRFLWLDRVALPFNHIILLATSITNMLLLWLHSSSILQVTSALFMTRSQLIIIILSICSLATLIRISHPFSSTDRWLILINVTTCALLLFTGYTQQTSMQDHAKVISVKPWLDDLHIMLPSQSIAFGLLLAALASLMWVRRRIPQIYRSMLKIGFGLTLICAMLQWLIPGFLLVGMITLTLSVIIATQVEQA